MPQLDFNLVLTDFVFLTLFFIIFYLFFYFFFLRRILSVVITRRILKDRLELMGDNSRVAHTAVQKAVDSNVLILVELRGQLE